MTLLAVADFREHLSTALPDSAIQRFLDAAENAINARRGPGDPITETRQGGTRIVSLGLSASGVTTVVEQDGTTSTTLAADDYELRLDRVHLYRNAAGTNPSDRWAPRVRVTYTPFDDIDERIRVQIALVKLDVQYSGSNAQSASFGTYWSEREAILDTFAIGGWPTERR